MYSRQRTMSRESSHSVIQGHCQKPFELQEEVLVKDRFQYQSWKQNYLTILIHEYDESERFIHSCIQTYQLKSNYKCATTGTELRHLVKFLYDEPLATCMYWSTNGNHICYHNRVNGGNRMRRRYWRAETAASHAITADFQQQSDMYSSSFNAVSNPFVHQQY